MAVNDPHRISIEPSTSHVRVEVNGMTVAETTQPTFLFEGNLPRRTYIPRADVRMDLLEPTDTASVCPFKGTARYWSLRIGDDVRPDVAWCYEDPIPEAVPIAGLIAFYDDKVDVIVAEPVA